MENGSFLREHGSYFKGTGSYARNVSYLQGNGEPAIRTAGPIPLRFFWLRPSSLPFFRMIHFPRVGSIYFEVRSNCQQIRFNSELCPKFASPRASADFRVALAVFRFLFLSLGPRISFSCGILDLVRMRIYISFSEPSKGIEGSEVEIVHSSRVCVTNPLAPSLRSADVFPVVASLPPSRRKEKRRPEIRLRFAG